MTHFERRLLLALSCLLAVSGPAAAAQKSFYIGRGDLFRGDGLQSSTGIYLPSGSLNSAIFSFALPGDYKKNTPVIIRYYFVSDGTACDLAVQADSVTRSRPGFQVAPLFGAASGLSKASANPISSPAPYTSFSADFKLRAPAAGPFANSQKPGDRFTVAIARNGVSDGCGNFLGVEDVKISYTTP